MESELSQEEVTGRSSLGCRHGRLAASHPKLSRPIFDIKFSSTTNRLYLQLGCNNEIHDLSTSKLLKHFQLENASTYHLVFHPNSLYIFTARLDNTLQMWETDTKQIVRNFVGHTDVVSSMQLSADQNLLLTSGWDGSIRIWNIGTG